MISHSLYNQHLPIFFFDFLETSLFHRVLGKLGGSAPAQQRRHALRHLESAAAALGDHGLRPPGIQQLGAVLQAQHRIQLSLGKNQFIDGPKTGMK